ncbi:MAG: ATP-grasp domain-containing protein, partial [Adlercreutzia sp.]|nr:ATP-grasp domain-containing protein [Adlercreutzia sp.]
MTKLAIIGASDFQNPLILAAKARGIETHVFAWEAGDVGERTADFFYPLSITEVDAIAEECRRIGVDGVACIGSDLGNITASAVAEKLGLTANSMECVRRSTNKELMRRTFEEHGDPSPRSVPVTAESDLEALGAALEFPVIVKPADRSGSRGITKLASVEGLDEAVSRALGESFMGEALVEEFAEGDEYSVEYISWQGEHRFLAVTEKFTTGAPMFIEKGHVEPARIAPEREAAIRAVVEHALDSLGVEYGASHSEVKVAADGSIKII